ncbi:PQQ-dependent dehydrogenase, methanol/ethanol family [Robiginitalea sp. SC105]|uniref:PQQ-dependent dehydrogenase, methanol/ethanol family n=1 Tax=Robiginitalea sp. SC105 TaxID=2762332 RepID=UPI00163A2806|nr:PQQ-dependent dehydrogenase, methanol/ethanol family [Robiginitalea sp. SC105]MBC2837720.1 PQQ-dependent dehydrogenase, methanol/ethanol family [Robiginitalea sp. SC105]
MKSVFTIAITAGIALVLSGCAETTGPESGLVSEERLLQASESPGEWLMYGRDYSETRFSPLEQINASNVDSLGLAWSLNLGIKRGIEATPVVANGIMYFTGSWSRVYAVDARTGDMVWTYDPEVPKSWGERACCDVVNRGVALFGKRLYFGSLDGRLIALDARTGEKEWEVFTIDPEKAYTITGAPRVVKGKVIIGNGGAEYGVRGYISAYDADSGQLDWRFYTVPGNPADGFENKAMEAAARTWTGEWWKFGGGGTAWDAMAFDPELDLLYVGTGNGAPWNRDIRSPGGGDNLYLSSILALDPDTGELAWHYQTTPGDTWDYTATQHIILADLEIGGSVRKVLMQAPKNGFFYVLDRTDGSLISAENYVYTNWATGIDPDTGRPVETEFSRYPESNTQIAPGPGGGHNWQPMAYNPETGLVYIPAREDFFFYGQPSEWEFNADPRAWNTAAFANPALESRIDTLANRNQGVLLAWDPVKQETVWQVREAFPWNSGLLSLKDLIFKGNAEGEFAAFDARTGEKRWSTPLNTGIIASPITYELDGTQYITILVGWGGVFGRWLSLTEQVNPGTVYTFALGGKAPHPEFPVSPAKELIDLPFADDPATLALGASLYDTHCSHCHGYNGGLGGGGIPDLRYSSPEVFGSYEGIVGYGAYLDKGMPNFGDRLSGGDIEAIRNYILAMAQQARSAAGP